MRMKKSGSTPKKSGRFLIILPVCFFLLLFCFSGWKLWNTLQDYKTGDDAYSDLEEEIFLPVEEVGSESEPADSGKIAPEETSPETTAEATEKETDTQKEETQKFTVDFTALKEKNADCVGWIYSPGTPISYPILQAENNTKYLRHLMNGEYARAGCIFVDYRCAGDFSDAGTIVYGHNLLTEKMFGTLTKYKKKSYYREHPELWIYLPTCTLRLEVIGAFTTGASNATVYSFPMGEEDLPALLEACREKTPYTIDFAEESISKVVVLSTCTNRTDSERFVVICAAEENLTGE